MQVKFSGRRKALFGHVGGICVFSRVGESILVEKGREMVQFNALFIGHDYPVLDGSAQFPDIPGPGIVTKKVQGIVAKWFEGATVFLCEFTQKGTGQQHDVFSSVPEGRHPDGHDVQSEEEILAELTGGDQFTQVPVGGGYHSDIDGNGGVGTHPLDGPFGEYTEEFDLGGGINFSDLVEEERAAIGLF